MKLDFLDRRSDGEPPAKVPRSLGDGGGGWRGGGGGWRGAGGGGWQGGGGGGGWTSRGGAGGFRARGGGADYRGGWRGGRGGEELSGQQRDFRWTGGSLCKFALVNLGSRPGESDFMEGNFVERAGGGGQKGHNAVSENNDENIFGGSAKSTNAN